MRFRFPMPTRALRWLAAPSFGPRLLLTLIPATVILSVALSTVWGNNGLVTRAKLQVERDVASERLATVDRENRRLLRELELMGRDPVVLERVVAEELSRGRVGTTLYTFDAEPTADPRR